MVPYFGFSAENFQAHSKDRNFRLRNRNPERETPKPALASACARFVLPMSIAPGFIRVEGHKHNDISLLPTGF